MNRRHQLSRLTRRAAPTLAVALLVVCAAAAGASAAEFDRTVPVARGTRLDVRLFGGEVVVRAWPRDAVRVQATHFRTDVIDVKRVGRSVTVSARSLRGTPHGIDFEIHVPSWMPVSVAGTYLNISVEGTRAAVAAATVRGDVLVRGGGDSLVLKSVEGRVTVEDAHASADLTAVNDLIRVTRLVGDLVADAVNGGVKLEDVIAKSVEVSTIGGDISWQGAMPPGGRYQFATHTGDVDVLVGRNASLTVTARAFEGLIRSSLAVLLPPRRDLKKTTFTLGSGASRLDLETFSGTISLR